MKYEVSYKELATCMEEPFESALHSSYASILESLELEEDEVVFTICKPEDSKQAFFTVNLGGEEESGSMTIDDMHYMVLVQREDVIEGVSFTAVDLATGYPHYF